MWLGDWAEAYQIVDRMGIRTLRDPYTDKPYVHFYSTKRVGGGVLNFEAHQGTHVRDLIERGRGVGRHRPLFAKKEFRNECATTTCTTTSRRSG
jgi:hypothetical protein